MSNKRGYPRKAYSFERVLKDLADEIGYDAIEKIIDKKRKAIMSMQMQAPFMVKSIAEQTGIHMPSFFGYILRYSIPILIPIFILVWLIFFVY